MKIARLLYIFLLGAFLLAAAIVVQAILLRHIQDDVEAAQERRHISNALARELHQSSDDLTRFARTFAVAGDKRYRDYFHQVLDIRNGKIARPEGHEGVYWDLVIAGALPEPSGESVGAQSLEDRMREAGITVDEFSKLKEAQNRSDRLVRREEVAMNALEGRFDDGTGAFSREGPPDREMAMRILHDKTYHEDKAAIMEPIDTFLMMVNTRTRGELRELNQYASRVLASLIATSVALLGLIAGLVWILHRRILRPTASLLATVGEIGEGDLDARTQIAGSDEIGTLAGAIDSMAGRLKTALGEVEERAEEARSQAKELATERDHSEKLLHNILPALIAERLKGGERPIAETYPEVTVLFADIVGFTQLAEKIGPREIVTMLNDIFGRFDDLALEHDLEKIKTIGDCYMVVGGVPVRSATHCQQVARFALDALKSFDDYAASFPHPLRIRIGMHTGTVVAGIVGTQKFSYDLWGDVVNVAARYESTATPNRIHVSEAVHVRLADDFEFEDAGEVELKGKGKMRSWFLIGPKSDMGTVIPL
ncbi:MAG: adenylate/guanylate cyclase domain-containing protein [Methyloceanibacter sp.]|jgi:class 3 adenylate cyclase/HAMP domain-containing protein